MVAGAARTPSLQAGTAPPAVLSMVACSGEACAVSHSVDRRYYSYSCGDLWLSRAITFNRQFWVCNESSVNVTINGIETSCGCTGAIFDAEVLPFKLGPHGRAMLTVVIDTRQLDEGPLSKSVTILAGAANALDDVLELTAILHRTAYITPSEADLGTISAGRLDAAGFLLHLPPGAVVTRCHSPSYLVVRKRAPGRNAPVRHASGSGVPGDAAGSTVEYAVFLSPRAPVGRFDELITCDVAGASGAEDGKQPEVTIRIRASVAGPCWANPDEVHFGVVPSGGTTQEACTLWTRPSRSIAGARIIETPPFIRVRIVRSPLKPAKSGQVGIRVGAKRPGPPVALATFDLSLMPSAPVGPIRARILLRIGNDQLVAIPISAYVVPAAP